MERLLPRQSHSHFNWEHLPAGWMWDPPLPGTSVTATSTTRLRGDDHGLGCHPGAAGPRQRTELVKGRHRSHGRGRGEAHPASTTPFLLQERIRWIGEIGPAQWTAMPEFLHSDTKTRCRTSGVGRCSVSAGATSGKSNRCRYRARSALHPRSKSRLPVSSQYGGLYRSHPLCCPVLQVGPGRIA